jgi:glycosyltransferase involved in cell wall biosynthesis
MNVNPLVSIALCTYNGEKFLNKQVDSLLSQDYKNIEIIIVDDSSKDSTLAILEEYQQKDSRIKLFRNRHNLGYTKNFEKALTLCTGKYIAFADQDDIWEKDKISICTQAIEGHIMVYHNSDFIDASDKPMNDYTVASRLRVYEGDSCLPFLAANCVHGHAVLFDSSLKKYLFPFNPKFSHDWWLAYVAFNIGPVKYMDKVLVHYRQHTGSITDTFQLRPKKNSRSKRVKGIERMSINLEMLKYCAEFKYNKDADLIKEAYHSFSNLAKGKAKLKAFWFLVKYFDLLFYIRSHIKSTFSKVNYVRKVCFD